MVVVVVVEKDGARAVRTMAMCGIGVVAVGLAVAAAAAVALKVAMVGVSTMGIIVAFPVPVMTAMRNIGRRSRSSGGSSGSEMYTRSGTATEAPEAPGRKVDFQFSLSLKTSSFALL